jgi:hypothetical protein
MAGGLLAPAAAGTYPHYLDVPRHFTLQPAIWAELLERADTETVLLELIALLRGAFEDPLLPVAIAVEVHRADGPPTDQSRFDQYAGVAWAIAQEDPAVLLLNMRRITEEDLGWGWQTEDFLADGVHLTASGQRSLAKKVLEALDEAAQDPPGGCADPNGDGVVDVDDLIAIIAAWGRTDGPQADVDLDGTVNVDDLLIVLLQWGPC